MLTANELKGHCERFGVKPSQRQRVIITRSTDAYGRVNATQRSIDKAKLGHTANNFMNDSLISANRVVRHLSTAGHSHAPTLPSSPDKSSHNYMMDVRKPKAPDAMTRIKIQQNINHENKMENKRRLAN
jgi:hypothetical protein